eukprot:jgi/Mesen1/8271/ME000448S07419
MGRLWSLREDDQAECSTSGRPGTEALGPNLIGAPAALLQCWNRSRAREQGTFLGQLPKTSRAARFVSWVTPELRSSGEDCSSADIRWTEQVPDEFVVREFVAQARQELAHGEDTEKPLHSAPGRWKGSPRGFNRLSALSLASMAKHVEVVEEGAVHGAPMFSLLPVPYDPPWDKALDSDSAVDQADLSVLAQSGASMRSRGKAREASQPGRSPPRQQQQQQQQQNSRKSREGEGEPLCWEVRGGVKRQYLSASKQLKGGRRQQQQHEEEGEEEQEFRLVDWDKRKGPVGALIAVAKSYILPEGYPESVAPCFTPYMQWRALQDGAGRIGKMMFARHGKKFDCDLKQLRFAGDVLMELGAGVELATMALPAFFLPLACAANVAKNVAAVTATSTRAPIYKAFARRENIGDVTAKGESISNLSDLMGTSLGIVLSKRSPSLVATFAVLSCGYLLSSFHEVKAVQLPTLNRARFCVAVRTFLETGAGAGGGQPPRVHPADHALGGRAAPGAGCYIVTYRPSKRRAFVVLKEGAKSEDVIRAAFQEPVPLALHAHLLLHVLQGRRASAAAAAAAAEGGEAGGEPSLRRELRRGSSSLSSSPSSLSNERRPMGSLSEDDVEAAVAESCRHTRALYHSFKLGAAAQGWTMAEYLLNPSDTRLCL